MPENNPTKFSRLVFIDFLRGLAVIWMLETHVVHVCMLQQYKQGFFYDVLNISNGFVAVTFLFCAGAGFWLAVQKKQKDYREFKAPLWIYLRRLGFILVIAYFIHLPEFSFIEMMKIDENQMISFLQTDILQTIVYTLFFSLIIFLIIPSLKYLKYIYAIIAIIIIFYTPYIWTLYPLSFMPKFFALMISTPPLSKFPFFPWSAYLLIGISVTSFFMESKNKKKFAMYLSLISLLLCLTVYYTRELPIPIIYTPKWWYSSPGHAIFRISFSIFGFGLLYLFEEFIKKYRFLDFIITCGQESLYFYTVHVFIVYGSITNYGIQYFSNNEYNPLMVIILFIALVAFCYASGKVWHNTKKTNPKLSRLVLYTSSIFLFIIFLFNN